MSKNKSEIIHVSNTIVHGVLGTESEVNMLTANHSTAAPNNPLIRLPKQEENTEIRKPEDERSTLTHC